jgi:hypothetical protein
VLFFYLTGKDTKLPCFLLAFQQQLAKNRLIQQLILHKNGICTNKPTLGISYRKKINFPILGFE